MKTFWNRNKVQIADLVERNFWTVVQGFLGIATTETLNIPPQYALLFMSAAALIKGIAAQHIGNHSSAATLPGDLDPTTPVK